MLTIHPHYYDTFRCIAGACRHSCCIGWEIDIDADTAAVYQAVPGSFGDRLRREISDDDPPHFCLGEGERCPFLNKDNLCDIILTLGEDKLCTICTEHPRFHNELPGRIESGLGFCCEEAARLILSDPQPMLLLADGTDDVSDPIIALRDEVIALLQDRTRTIPQRINDMLARCGTSMPQYTLGDWVREFLALERLDALWTDRLEELEQTQYASSAAFDAYMAERQTEYEQLLVYFVYRHMANAPDEAEAAARACFACLAYTMIHALGAIQYEKTGAFSFDDQTELCRLYSSEIEYSQDNTDALLDLVYQG